MIEDKQCPNCQRKYGYWKWTFWPRRKPFSCKSCGELLKFEIEHNSVLAGLIGSLSFGVSHFLYTIYGFPFLGIFCFTVGLTFVVGTIVYAREWYHGRLILVDDAGLPLDPNHEIKSV